MNRWIVKVGAIIVALTLLALGLWGWARWRAEGRSPADIGIDILDGDNVSPDVGDGLGPNGDADGDGDSSSDVPGVQDAVPMDTVDELFNSLQEQGLTPSMNETFTVVYDESFDRIKVSGEFADEGSKTLVFERTPDGAWEVVEEGQ